MEGKNFFRTRWEQRPLYSGGNVATVLTPDSHELCLVMACGDTVNVVRASDGACLCAYTLPIADVILTLDAVTALDSYHADRIYRQDLLGSKRRAVDGGASLPDDLKVPPGCYVALGTRALQLHLLRIDAVGSDDQGATDGSEVVSGLSYVLRSVQGWTASQQAISLVSFTAGGQYLISAAADGNIKVWNVFHHHLTHNLRCAESSVVQCAALDHGERYLAIGSFEGHVSVFDFVEKRLVAHARPHVQAIHALVFSDDGEHIISVSGDRKIAFLRLDAAKRTLAEERGIAIKEDVTCAAFESAERLHVGAADGILATYLLGLKTPATAVARCPAPSAPRAEGELDENMLSTLVLRRRPKGCAPFTTVRLGDGAELPDEADAGDASPPPPLAIFAANAAFNITLWTVPAALQRGEMQTYAASYSLVCSLDQVLDIVALPAASGFSRAVVTNSNAVYLFTAAGCYCPRSLVGHRDVVMSCSVSADGTLLATGAQDAEVRVWSLATGECLCRGVRGHTAGITGVAFNRKHSDTYAVVFSVSSDESLRLWDVHAAVTGGSVKFQHLHGIAGAHAGPIYTLAVAPNDQYVATAGKDKVVALWNVNGKKLFKETVLRGHRRGVSSLAFSPTDRVLASASNDGSVRLWSLVSLSCVKTLQSDATAVLRVVFFNGGTQVATTNAEGVLRVWAIASAESVWSSELHEDKTWSLAVVEEEVRTAAGDRDADGEGGDDGDASGAAAKAPETITVLYSGSADGVLIASEDYTREEVKRVRSDRHETVTKAQTLLNSMRQGKFREAFRLALQLNHPRHLRLVLSRWIAADPVGCETALRAELLPELSEEMLVKLLQFTREWITNSKHCVVASVVTGAFLSSRYLADAAKFPAMTGLVEPLLAYSARHSRRQQDLLHRLYYMDYLTRALTPTALTSDPPHAPTPSPLDTVIGIKRMREE